MPRATAQIVIQLDPETGEFRAEVPSPNGSRRKIELPSDSSLWGDLIGVELLELNSWLRDQEKFAQEHARSTQLTLETASARFKWTLDKHRKIWDQTARDHNRGKESGVEFANRTLGSRKDPNIRIRNVAAILAKEE